MRRLELTGIENFVRKDAINWYKQWAEHGSVADHFNLGYMYEIGWSVPQDYAIALNWYRKAADKGYVQAQYKLGLMYYKGKGVPRHYAEAHVWISIAVASGYQGGYKKLDASAQKLSADDLKAAQSRAVGIFEDIQQRKAEG